MELKKLKTTTLFVCFMLTSFNVFANRGLSSLVRHSGSFSNNIWNISAFTIVIILLLTTVTTLVIGKSQVSKLFLRKSAKADSFWDVEKLKLNAKESLYRLNDAVTNKEISRLKKHLVPELYTLQSSIISELIGKGEKNILKCTNLKVLEIIGCEDYKNDSKDRYVAYLEGEMLNYTLSESTGKITRNKNRNLSDFSYSYHFVRIENEWRLEQINDSVNRLDILKTKMVLEE